MKGEGIEGCATTTSGLLVAQPTRLTTSCGPSESTPASVSGRAGVVPLIRPGCLAPDADLGYCHATARRHLALRSPRSHAGFPHPWRIADRCPACRNAIRRFDFACQPTPLLFVPSNWRHRLNAAEERCSTRRLPPQADPPPEPPAKAFGRHPRRPSGRSRYQPGGNHSRRRQVAALPSAAREPGEVDHVRVPRARPPAREDPRRRSTRASAAVCHSSHFLVSGRRLTRPPGPVRRRLPNAPDHPTW